MKTHNSPPNKSQVSTKLDDQGYETENITATGQLKDLRSINAGYITALEEELGDISIPDQLLNRTKVS